MQCGLSNEQSEFKGDTSTHTVPNSYSIYEERPSDHQVRLVIAACTVLEPSANALRKVKPVNRRLIIFPVIAILDEIKTTIRELTQLRNTHEMLPSRCSIPVSLDSPLSIGHDVKRGRYQNLSVERRLGNLVHLF